MASVIVPVPVELVPRVWPTVQPWLQLPCDKCGVWTIEEAQERCTRGVSALWMVFDSDRPHAALVTEVDGSKAWVALIGGTGALTAIGGNLEKIEGWALAWGARFMEMDGRKGWVRVLKGHGYQADGTIVWKELR